MKAGESDPPQVNKWGICRFESCWMLSRSLKLNCCLPNVYTRPVAPNIWGLYKAFAIPRS